MPSSTTNSQLATPVGTPVSTVDSASPGDPPPAATTQNAAEESTNTPPPIHKLSEDAKVSEYFAWKGIGGFKEESNRYQVEIRGSLTRGRFIKKMTLIQHKSKGKWITIPIEKLKGNLGFEFEYNVPDFSFRMNIPKGQYRIHAVLFIDEETFEYDFEFETSDKWPAAPPPATKAYLCVRCFTFGVGLNYLNYRQTAPDDLDPINYTAFGPLPLSLEGRWAYHRKHAFRFEYHRQSGPAIKAENINLDNKNIDWSYMTLGGDSLLRSTGKLLGLSYSNGFLYGVQIHSIPFLVSSSSTNYTISASNLYSLGGGGFTGIRFGESELIFMMRVQVALMGQGDVKLKSGLSFDGALSYLSDSGKSFFWGLYWGGQYHSYKYEIATAGAGTYSLILSKFEGRLGYRF